MASSSKPSSSSSSCVSTTRSSTYDIFLSFRGEDTRNNFVDYLYTALVQKGIHTFKDAQMLGGGKPISGELLKAIKESRFAVVVFSKNYANSSWCLEELSEIMEYHDRTGLTVFPVFYHVDPSDVRGQKRDFATAFELLEKKYKEDMEKVNKWRKALTTAANIIGYHISSVSGGESATINMIIQDILGYMEPRGLETNLIGIESHMDALKRLIGIQATDEVRTVGIVGMGGIGKTTIARALYRRISNKFDGKCFVDNVREKSSSRRDICTMQENILIDVLGTRHKFTIEDTKIGASMIKDKLSNKKVLLVLDDVQKVEQLEFLAAEHEWFGPGSRIIITTRNKLVLSYENAKYEPALLRMDQALELFSRHAFKKDSPPDEFKELSNRAISYTGRLPLALKVLGSFFHGRKVDVWGSALDRLANTPNSEINKTLMFSFDRLEEAEQKIFLDIACFFKGMNKSYVTTILDSFGFYGQIGVDSLIANSLITISKNRLDMHDLIQEMGWHVVRQNIPNSRLWKNEEIHDFINENKNLEVIEAIVKPWQYYDDQMQGFSANVFNSMKNLRLLVAYGEFTCRKPSFLPYELRWLCWDYYPFSSLPLANMHKLVGLEMEYASIKHLWKGQKIMRNLKFIELKKLDCLSRFPNVSQAPNIEKVILSDCTNLVEVDESLGLIKRLVHLEMNECVKLKCLPSRFEMESLEILILCCCTSLKRLPQFSDCMIKLSHIDCSACYSLEELPDSICMLKCLNTLLLQGCSKLEKLPNEFGNMEKLQELSLRKAECFIFHALPRLSCLRKLDLSFNNIGDQDFPINLGGFSSLEVLVLSGNMLSHLSTSISHLSSLKHLDLSGCERLQGFNGLPSKIQILKASHCTSLETIRDLTEEYEWLNNIQLNCCKKLVEDKDNEIYLDKMLKKSFLKKWAAKNCCLIISIPGSKIPRWFKEQVGNNISLKLPFKWQTEIIGFAVCVVSRWPFSWDFPSIDFRFENGETLARMLEVDCINASATTSLDDEDENVWIGYIPLSLLENMHHNSDDDDCECKDWSHIIEGNLIIEYAYYVKRCGAQIVYKEDVEPTQQIIEPSISSSYSWNWKLTHDRWSRNNIVCSETF